MATRNLDFEKTDNGKFVAEYTSTGVRTAILNTQAEYNAQKRHLRDLHKADWEQV